MNEFPRENLRFLEVLGEGQFGEVHLCEASDMARYVDNDYILNRSVTRPILVAVKILSLLADDRARYVISVFVAESLHLLYMYKSLHLLYPYGIEHAVYIILFVS